MAKTRGQNRTNNNSKPLAGVGPGQALKRLRAPEKALVACVKRGEPCSFDENAPVEERTIRAVLIECLLRGQKLPGKKQPIALPPKGLDIHYARIEGTLDLECCKSATRLRLYACAFQHPIILRDARIGGLNLSGSELAGIVADRLRIDGPLFLRDIIHRGEIRISGAAIVGNLELCGARLENTDRDEAAAGPVLALDGAKIGGSAFLDRVFSAKGEIRAHDATIAGELSFSGARLENTHKEGVAVRPALALDRVRIGGNTSLDKGFSAKGEIRASGATIEGDLSLRGARLENTDKDGAPAGDALMLQKATVSGAFMIDKAAEPCRGIANLNATVLAEITDDGSFWPEKDQGNVILDGMTFMRFLAHPPTWRSCQKWLLRQIPEHLGNEFAPQPWVQCAKVLREMGHERDARILLYEMNETRRRTLRINWRKPLTIRPWKNSWHWIWSQILRLTAGHGYRPAWSLAWIAVIIAFGAFIFAKAEQSDRMTPAKERFYLDQAKMQEYDLTGVLPAGYPNFSPILYSIDVFLPIVSFSQEEHWRPANLPFHEGLQARWWKPWTWNVYRAYNRIHIGLGWILTSIAVLAFTGVIKRE